MTSSELRQSFLDFFREKGHTVVPSASLMPGSPNLLFTNAGMNQFVPIFLGEAAADVDKWPGAIPGKPTRATDTQKCIRAGGKHNDLDDVGLDTYHHTFFEMLGNWSFGDYFKTEAIAWAWELVVGRWKFPPQRLYATVYCPHMDPETWREEMSIVQNAVENLSEQIVHSDLMDVYYNEERAGRSFFASINPAASDYTAAWHWWKHFRDAGLDPMVHIVPGNKKDNFWMMGETGPCGPCSELHVDLTPAGDTKGKLVNMGTAECIEIWNLVFIQFNANPDGTFSPLPAKHVDTGMGFERVASIIQGTKNFTDFANAKISNYETDIFRPIFDELEKMSGHRYGCTLPASGSTGDTEEEKIDVAFRVIADHIRTLSFAIADGIQPGNTDRNYVLRRILRRAVKYGRTLGFHKPFFYQLVDVLARTMGDVFPEIRVKQKHVEEVLKYEEEAFNRTLDRGIELFNDYASSLSKSRSLVPNGLKLYDIFRAKEVAKADAEKAWAALQEIEKATPALQELAGFAKRGGKRAEILLKANSELAALAALAAQTRSTPSPADAVLRSSQKLQKHVDSYTNLLHAVGVSGIDGEFAFRLYDEQGFPLDLTQLMARERSIGVDVDEFKILMQKQREQSQAAQKREIISVSNIDASPTKFIGYDFITTPAIVLDVVEVKGKTAVILDVSTCYAEMGGQVGDTGEIEGGGALWHVVNTQKTGPTWLHFLAESDAPAVGASITLTVDTARRAAIARHHTVTHLLHLALHAVVNPDATQKGSFVGPDKLTFDFNSPALTPQQIRDVERLVNEKIVENAPVSWTEVPYSDVRANAGIMQFFGEKYGDVVRVVQIGGERNALNGYSMELCGGTHVRATGEIGLFRIVSESAIAAGVRRIEAVAGLEAYNLARTASDRIAELATKLNAPVGDLEKKLDALLTEQKELQKQLKATQQRQATDTAQALIAKAETLKGTPAIIANLGAVDGDTLQAVADALKGKFSGVAVLAGAMEGSVAIAASVAPEFVKAFQAGKIIQAIAPIVGGKGGGRPDFARGAGKDASQLDAALAKARGMLES